MTQEPKLDHERVRRQRNVVLGSLLAAFCLLVFFISIAKMT